MAAHAQAKPLHCVADQLTAAQRKSVGDALLSGDGSDAAQALVENATASCATRFKPAELNAAVDYANSLSTLEAGRERLKALGSSADLVDALWDKYDPGQRKAVADGLKAGAPPAYVLSDLSAKTGGDLTVMTAALMTLTAKATVSAADSQP